MSGRATASVRIRARAPRTSPASARAVWVGAVAVVAVLVLWELLGRLGGGGARIPVPTAIGAALAGLVIDPGFWAATGQTLLSAALGLVLAALAGVVAGTAYGTFVFLRHSTSALIELLRPIPPVALLPVGLLLFGTSLQMKLALIVYTAFWPVFIQTAYGLRDIDGTLVDMARIHRVRRGRRLLGIVLPSIGPYIAVGLRLSVIGALIASIVSELIGGAPGLGYALGLAQSTGQTARMYALVVVIGVLGLLADRSFGLMERISPGWSPANRERGRS
ncbi:ABC transporter permease [Microbacterium panaciterrae]|uniref:ABC transmembrane type-1 domain-containing protein n=1 Tax=Microbacterium panaciterrae TaxID=985759 RepID=A0ABP8PQ68_9MICO